MTKFLKFANEAEAITVLEAYRNEEGWIQASHTHALDVIGTLHTPTGKMLKDGDFEYPEMKPLPGFHVNFIGELPDALKPFEIFPTSPQRIFAC